MHCPFCHTLDTKVIDSRLSEEGTQVRRRRECTVCNERFSTYEIAELVLPRVIKNNGNREEFNEAKLRAGISKALEKRPVSIEAIDRSLSNIRQKMRASGEREMTSTQLGEWVMDELHELDDVAYVRFASVYRRFEDLGEFRKVIRRLERKIPAAEATGQQDR